MDLCTMNGASDARAGSAVALVVTLANRDVLEAGTLRPAFGSCTGMPLLEALDGSLPALASRFWLCESRLNLLRTTNRMNALKSSQHVLPLRRLNSDAICHAEK